MLTVIAIVQVASRPDTSTADQSAAIVPTPPTVAPATSGAAAAVVPTPIDRGSSSAAPAASAPAPAAQLAAATTYEEFLSAAGTLPDGPGFAQNGPGTYHVVPGTTPQHGTGPRVFTYSIDVEDGIEDAGADAEFATAVDAALSDQRSWVGGGQFTLSRVDTGTPSFQVTLASQMTIRSVCGFDIPLESSCYSSSVGRVMINVARWSRGALTYGGDLDDYRVYAINHEVGHALGFGHEPCKGNGDRAPVMMQQSWSVSNDQLNFLNPQLIPRNGAVCVPNPYPFPDNPAGQAPAVAAG